MMLAICAGVGASAAFAGKPIHDTFGGQGAGDGQFAAAPGGIAIDPSNGDVLVLDQGNGRIQRFDTDGGYLDQFGSGQLSLQGSWPPPQVAIDPADGSVYVADLGNDRIVKFDSAGAVVDDFDASDAPTTPLAGPHGVAIGPGGVVYVADTGNDRIVEFDSSGAYVSEFGTSGSSDGELSRPSLAAVDSAGAVYVTDGNLDFDAGRVQKFDAGGAFQYVVNPGELASAGLAVDPTTDHVFIPALSGDFTTYRVVEVDESGTFVDTHGDGAGFDYSATGLAARGGRVYVSNLVGLAAGDAVLILDEPVAPAPTATIDPVTTFTATTATFTGTVNANGAVGLSWRFEMSADGGTTWEQVGAGSEPEGSSDVAVSVEAAGLSPNKPYEVRLTATKRYGLGSDAATTTFATDPAPPLVRPLAAGSRTAEAAWLGAEVNPQNSSTVYYVEYTIASDSTYGSSSRVPAAPGSADAGDGGEFVTVTQLVTGLEPETEYRFRVVASNATGETVGPDRTFTTRDALSEPPAGRAYEMVSPLDKNGGAISPTEVNGDGFAHSDASPSGDVVAYGSVGAFAGADSNSLVVQYRSSRMAGGWTTRAVSAPYAREMATPGDSAPNLVAFSEGLDRGAVSTSYPLVPGADALLGPTWGLYRGQYTGSSPAYELLSAPTVPLPVDELGVTAINFAAASSDFSSIAFNARNRPLLSGAGPNGVYQWTNGELRLASVLPDGSPASDPVAGARAPNHGEPVYVGDHPVSDDGHRVFFTDRVGPSPGFLYVREHGASTALLSGSERTGDDPTAPVPGTFQAADASDGSHALFTAAALTGDSSATYGSPDLYLWASEPDEQGHHLTNITPGHPNGADALAIAAAADDLTRIYFVANGAMAPGAIDGDCGSDYQNLVTGERCNLYSWSRASGLTHVAVLGAEDHEVWSVVRHWKPVLGRGGAAFRNARISADGARLLFQSQERLTAYDNAGTDQVYLYDAGEDRLACVSCSSVSGSAPSDATLKLDPAPPGTRSSAPPRLPRNLSKDGHRAFFQTAARLSPEDVNGRSDVYMWEEGDLSLVSPGTGNFDADFIAASASGDDVFFTTRQQLVGSDVDNQADMYDARVGGGFPEQNVPPECVGDDCQGDQSSPPRGPEPGSLALDGRMDRRAGRATFSTRRLTARQLAQLARGRAVVMRVTVSRAGTVSATARARWDGRPHTVAAASRVAGRAGIVRLRLRLKPAARARLIEGSRLKATLSVRFTGTRTSRRLTLRLKSAARPVNRRKSSRAATTYRRTSR